MTQVLLRKYWFPLVVLVLIVVLAILVNRYREKAIEFKKQRDEKTQALSLATATINDMQVRQRDVAALDAKCTKELADANAANDALRRRLDNGGRVRVKGSVPLRITPPPPAAWAMQEPSNSLTLLDETFSVSDPESSATRKP